MQQKNLAISLTPQETPLRQQAVKKEDLKNFRT